MLPCICLFTSQYVCCCLSITYTNMTAVPSTSCVLQPGTISHADFLVISLVSMFIVAERRIAKPVRVLETRVSSTKTMPKQHSSSSKQKEDSNTTARHSNTRKWRPFLVAMAAGFLPVLCLFWELNSSQEITKWLASHLRQCWCLVATTASACWRVCAPALHHLCHGILLLAQAFSECLIRLLYSDFFLVAVALACCSLLHLALSGLLLFVRPVRHALSFLEQNLSVCPCPVLTATTLLWRALVTAIIICVFAAVGTRAW